MDKKTAIEIINQAINAGTLKGIYSLADIKTILEALEIISTDKK